MKRIAQFIFHGEDSSLNYPSSLTLQDWKFNILAKYGSVSHLGIQGEPGLIFYLNQGNNPITIGETGIYELNLEGIGRIHSLRFNEAMLTDIYKKEKNPFHRLIVDIVYEGAEPV